MSIPGSASPLFFGAGAGEAAAFQIDRSVRINSADSAYFSRTPSSAGNLKTWTLSFWIKKHNEDLGLIYTAGPLSGTGDNAHSIIRIHQNNLEIYLYQFASRLPNWSGGNGSQWESSALFRDFSAWQHLVIRMDTTQSTASDRLRVYQNGVLMTPSTSNYPTQNSDAGDWFNSHEQFIGRGTYNTTQYLSAYLAEFHGVNGQSLPPTDFGEYDDNNVWQPKAYSGSYGTNGFYLKFDDNSSNAALGNDSSGNDNDWTVNNLTATVGTVYSATSSGMSSPGLMFDGDTSTSPSLTADGTVYTMLTGVSIACSSSLRINANANNFQVSVNGGSYTSAASVNSTYLSLSVPSGNTLTSLTFKDGAGGGYGVRALEVDGTVLVDGDPASLDSLIDTPTNYTADSGNNGGNYCTLNPLDDRDGATYSNGNLQVDGAGAGYHYVGRASFGVSSGKWYWEATINSSINSTYYPSPGIASMDENVPNQLGDGAGGHAYMANGQKYTSATLSSYGASFTQGDIIGFALDMDAGTLTAYKNGTSQGTMVTGLTGTWSPSWSHYQSTSLIYNFGQRPFADTPPSNHLALVSTNLSDPTIADGSTAMDVALWTGNGTSKTITGVGHSPDLLWIKGRSDATSHYLTDTVRGITKYLISSQGSQEGTNSNRVTALTSDGFTVGTHTSFNNNNSTYVGWSWDAGTSTVSNTDGTITSSVRANTSAGFSIVTYSGASTNSQVGHGLGSAPELIFIKRRNGSASWVVYHSALTAYYQLFLNDTSNLVSNGYFDNKSPTSTTFWVSDFDETNRTGSNYVAYCWAPVDQYSAFGSYEGNANANGPFAYTGFQPKWILLKNADQGVIGYDWVLYDAERDTYNPGYQFLCPNADTKELRRAGDSSDKTTRYIDILSNGFKLRNSNANYNGNGDTHVWAAFAEHPFKTARAR